MKNLFDKLIIGIFYVLCIIGFFLVVCELPNLLNNLFNTNIFEGTTTISFIFCVFILGYTLNYFENRKHNEEIEKELNDNKKEKGDK